MTVNIFLIKDSVEWITRNTPGLLLIILLVVVLCRYCHNKLIVRSYKRECCPDKYQTKRRFEEAYEQFKQKGPKDMGDDQGNGRDYVYLIDDKNKMYHRVVDFYTLHLLGYPRPSRSNAESFSSEGYTIGKEVRIYNVISDIEVIRSFAKNK